MYISMYILNVWSYCVAGGAQRVSRGKRGKNGKSGNTYMSTDERAALKQLEDEIRYGLRWTALMFLSLQTYA